MEVRCPEKIVEWKRDSNVDSLLEGGAFEWTPSPFPFCKNWLYNKECCQLIKITSTNSILKIGPDLQFLQFEIKDLGNLKYFFAMEGARTKDGIFVPKWQFTLDLPTETDMLGCCPTDTSIEFNCKLENLGD